MTWSVDIVAWALVAWATGAAVFRGFVRGPVISWITPRIDERLVSRLRWELQRGRTWTRQEAEGGAPPPDAVVLDDAALADRRAQLAALTRVPLWRAAMMYLMTCTLCQSWWAALCWSALALRGRWALVDAAAWSLAVAALAVGIDVLFGLADSRPPEMHDGRSPGCPGCGRRVTLQPMPSQPDAGPGASTRTR